MSNGTRTEWERGPRSTRVGKDQKGNLKTITGKHGGPVIEQTVTKRIVPKGKAS